MNVTEVMPDGTIKTYTIPDPVYTVPLQVPVDQAQEIVKALIDDLVAEGAISALLAPNVKTRFFGRKT